MHSNISINHNRFDNNTAEIGGDILYAEDGNKISIFNSTFTGDGPQPVSEESPFGGAIFSHQNNLSIMECRFCNKHATVGVFFIKCHNQRIKLQFQFSHRSRRRNIFLQQYHIHLTINQVRVVVTRIRDSTDSITVPNWLPTKVQLTISAVEFINVSDVPVPASPSNHIPRKTTLSAFLIELLPQPMKVILLTETNSADSKEKCEDDLHLTVVLKASEYISKLLKFENEKFMTRL